MDKQLIAEVERRPVLYDKSLYLRGKITAREEAWRDVANVTKQCVVKVKRRWRTLRDSFIRFRRLQRMSSPRCLNKKKTWTYHNEIAFLIPYVEPRDASTRISCCKPYGFDGDENNERTVDRKTRSADTVSLASDTYKAELTTPSTGCICYDDAGVQHQEPFSRKPTEPDGKRKNTDGLTEPDGKRKNTDGPSEPVAADTDEHFALSCVAALRRLSARKNSETRVKIMRVIYEAEYGGETAS